MRIVSYEHPGHFLRGTLNIRCALAPRATHPLLLETPLTGRPIRPFVPNCEPVRPATILADSLRVTLLPPNAEVAATATGAALRIVRASKSGLAGREGSFVGPHAPFEGCAGLAGMCAHRWTR